jgi:hypothetical protein
MGKMVVEESYGDGIYQKPYHRIAVKKGSFRIPIKL